MKTLSVASIILLLLISHLCSSQAIDSLKQLIKTEKIDSIKTYLFKDLSRQYLILQELDSCLKYSKKGKEIALKIGDHAAEAYNSEMEGNFYYYIGLYERAMDIFTHTVRTGEELHDSGLKARSYSMMGWIYLEQRRFEGALDVFTQALFLLKSGNGRSEDLALAYYGLADVYSYGHSSLKNFDLAKLYFDSALRVTPGLQKRERAFVLSELGGAFRDSDNNYKRCIVYLAQAEKILRNEAGHRDTYAYVLAELAYTYTMNQELEKGRRFARQTILIYDQLPAYRKVTSVYYLLAETFEMLGEIGMAYKMEKLNRSLSDSLFNHRNILLVEQIRAQYEDERKQAEIKSLTISNSLNSLEASNNRKIAIVVSVASSLILGLGLVTYYNRNRYQKKMQTLKFQQSLREQKDQIARELHDSLGGQLSSISIGLSRVIKGINTELIQWAQEMTDRAIHELRDSLWVMNKESVSIADIEQRINGLFWQYRKIETPIDLLLKIEDDLANYHLTSSTAGDLYRIIQEATHNSIKHSGAHRLQIIVKKQTNSIQITISDDGIGFEVPDLERGERYGMGNMKKRAEQINAKFTIDSTSGAGTKILINVPMTNLGS